jgi:hypothetical protein
MAISFHEAILLADGDDSKSPNSGPPESQHFEETYSEENCRPIQKDGPDSKQKSAQPAPF